MRDYKESNTLQEKEKKKRRPPFYFEGRRRLYTGYLWIADVNRVPVYNCINYFCLFFLWQLKRCWQTTTLMSNFTTQDRHMKPVYRHPLISVHRLAAKLFVISTLKSKYLFTMGHRQRTDAPATGTAIKNWSVVSLHMPISREPKYK